MLVVHIISETTILFAPAYISQREGIFWVGGRPELNPVLFGSLPGRTSVLFAVKVT